jgi:hypothetical protein
MVGPQHLVPDIGVEIGLLVKGFNPLAVTFEPATVDMISGENDVAKTYTSDRLFDTRHLAVERVPAKDKHQ